MSQKNNACTHTFVDLQLRDLTKYFYRFSMITVIDEIQQGALNGRGQMEVVMLGSLGQGDKFRKGLTKGVGRYASVIEEEELMF